MPKHTRRRHGPYAPEVVLVDLRMGSIYEIGGEHRTLAMVNRSGEWKATGQ